MNSIKVCKIWTIFPASIFALYFWPVYVSSNISQSKSFWSHACDLIMHAWSSKNSIYYLFVFMEAYIHALFFSLPTPKYIFFLWISLYFDCIILNTNHAFFYFIFLILLIIILMLLTFFIIYFISLLTSSIYY